MINGHAEGDIAYAQGIAVGHCTTWLETFAERSGVPFEVLAERVGTQLLGTAHGAGLGTDDHVPTLRRETAKRSAVLESVALAGGAHRKPQVNLNKQATYRTVECPACGAEPGRFCVSLGLRKSPKGTEMRTSCHGERIEAAGMQPRNTMSAFLEEDDWDEKPTNNHKASWTPERRRAAAERMAKMNRSGKMARAKALKYGL